MCEVREDIELEYSKDLNVAKVSASTFNQHIGLLKLVWRTLEKEIRGNGIPWNEVKRHKLQSTANSRRPITPEQFAHILKTAGDTDLHDLIFTIGWTGQRLGDVVLMRWDAIVVRSKLSVIQLVPRKTARRTGKKVLIPVLPPLAALLEKRRKHKVGELVFPEIAAIYKHDPTVLTRRIQKTFEDAGLIPREERAKLKRKVAVYGAHSLRHFFVTEAMAAGWPPQLIRKITGHSSDTMQDHYEHVDVALMARLAEQLAERPTLPPILGPALGREHPTTSTMNADETAALEKISTLAGKMNGKNWKAMRDQIAMLANPAPLVPAKTQPS